MAEDLDTLTFKKEGSTVEYDLYESFGMRTTGVVSFIPTEVKELPSRDWADAHGTDTYFPDEGMLAEYDVDVELAYKGDACTAASAMRAFRDFLTTGGTELRIYSPYTATGCAGAYLKGFSDITVRRVDGTSYAEYATFTATFRVTAPDGDYSD